MWAMCAIFATFKNECKTIVKFKNNPFILLSSTTPLYQ